MSVLTALEDVLKRVQIHHPFYYFMCADLELVESHDISTMGTDGQQLLYNPDFVSLLSRDELEGVLLHEFQHVVLLHPWLSEKALLSSLNKLIWELALEYVANREVVFLINGRKTGSVGSNSRIMVPSLPGSPASIAAVLELVKRGLFDGMNPETESSHPADEFYFYDRIFEEMDFREIYAYIAEKLESLLTEESDKSGAAAAAVDSGQGELKDLDGWKVTERYLENLIEKHLSGSDDAARRVREKFQLAPTIFGAGWDKIFGQLPKSVQHVFDEIMQPEVNWRNFLANVAARLTDTDEFRPDVPNFSHPLADEIIFPGLRSEKPENIFIAIDTSGSIDQEMLSQFLAECASILRYVDEVGVMTVDSEKSEIQYLKPSSLKHVKVTGGGGTDFRPAFETLREQRVRPALFVYFTDGFGSFPQKPAQFPVLWVLTKNSAEVPAGLGKVAHLSRV